VDTSSQADTDYTDSKQQNSPRLDALLLTDESVIKVQLQRSRIKLVRPLWKTLAIYARVSTVGSGLTITQQFVSNRDEMALKSPWQGSNAHLLVS